MNLRRLFCPALTVACASLSFLPSVVHAQQQIRQSSTARKIPFLLVQSSDHISPLTGATPTVTISKNGAAFAAPAGSVSEVGNGWYALTPSATDTGTLGPLIVHATATGADPADKEFNIVAFNPDDVSLLGLTGVATLTNQSNATTDVVSTLLGTELVPGYSVRKALYTGGTGIPVAEGKPGSFQANTSSTGAYPASTAPFYLDTVYYRFGESAPSGTVVWTNRTYYKSDKTTVVGRTAIPGTLPN